MRAQFATIEALISLAIVLSASTFVAQSISMNAANIYSESERLRASVAAYDLIGQIEGNFSTRTCIASLGNVTGACASNLLNLYEKAYGMHFSLAVAGIRLGDAVSGGATECVRMNLSGDDGSEAVCVGESWGT